MKRKKRRSPSPERGFHIKNAQDEYIWDAQGIRYLDLTSGWNVVNAGWNNQAICGALHRSIDILPFRPGWCIEDKLLALESVFQRLAPGYLIIPSCSGGEAIDNALKIARMVTGLPGVLTHTGGYHGNTTGAAFAAGFEISHLAPLGIQDKRWLLPSPECPLSPKSMKKLAGSCESTGAIVFETVQTNAGCYTTSDRHLSFLSMLAKRNGCVLICDEIGTGINRIGSLLSVQQRRVKPDIIVLGKALTNGLYPLSLCLVSEALKSFLDWEGFSSTFAGAPLGCVAALATLKYHDTHELGARAAEIGTAIKRRLKANLARCKTVKAIRGEGLELAVHIDWFEASSIKLTSDHLLERLQQRGVFATLSANHDLMVMPPLTSKLNELLHAMDAIADVLRA